MDFGLATDSEAGYSWNGRLSSRPPHKVYYCQMTFSWTTSFLSDTFMLDSGSCLVNANPEMWIAKL